jgi:predicted ATPase
MSNKLERIRVEHYRSLLNVDVKLKDINILFGANGTGKSTLIDAILLIRDCYKSSVDDALNLRGQGVGILWNGLPQSDNFQIVIESSIFRYSISFGSKEGRFDSSVGELLSPIGKLPIVDKRIGSSGAVYYDHSSKNHVLTALYNSATLAIAHYPTPTLPNEVRSLRDLLGSTYFFYFRQTNFRKLKSFGSESSPFIPLFEDCDNLWSSLRNLKDKRETDMSKRYEIIIQFMRNAFPSFRDLQIIQTGVMTVYGYFLENHRQNPVSAFHISDGYLQMLIHLTALFSQPQETYSLIMFDEPETSLHPWAIAVFAGAVKLATKEWNRQVIIATHSPVLMSQFESDQCLVAELGDKGQTEFKRVSEMPDMEDWLNQYALGSLYMSEAIAPQSKSHSGNQ